MSSHASSSIKVTRSTSITIWECASTSWTRRSIKLIPNSKDQCCLGLLHKTPQLRQKAKMKWLRRCWKTCVKSCFHHATNLSYQTKIPYQTLSPRSLSKTVCSKRRPLNCREMNMLRTKNQVLVAIRPMWCRDSMTNGNLLSNKSLKHLSVPSKLR